MTKEEYNKQLIKSVETYTRMQNKAPNSSMIREVRWSYAEMAQGGDGGPTGAVSEGSIREEYYPGYPDCWFQEVIDLMGWFVKGMPKHV